MLTWKKPFAIVIASAGVLVGSAHAQLTFGQSTIPSYPVSDEIGGFVSDSQPFSTPYRNGVSPTTKRSPNPKPVASHGFSAGQQASAADRLPSIAAASNSGSPTVIVRPPANDSAAINDLTVNVEKIAGTNDREFAVRLMVPDSVTVIDVTPVQDANSVRKFKIHLEQTSDQEADDQESTIDSIYSMPIAAPVHSASSLNAIQPSAQPNLSEPAETPQTIPVKKQSPARKGFQKNPFFQPDESKQASSRQSKAMTPGDFGPPMVLEAIDPPVVEPVDQNLAKQASHSATSIDAVSDLQVDGLASHMSHVPAFEPKSTIHSALIGPSRMGLGDTGDFTICLTNPSDVTFSELAVQLDIPSGLEVVILDRVAAVNPNAGTMTWRIPELKPAEEQLIRYRVRSLVEGTQHQQVWVGSDVVELQASEFETVVDVEFESAEAPLLPFESN